MAQTNFTPISIYYSATAAAVPTAGNLIAGELAINTADGKLFYKDSNGVVQTIASKAGALGDVVGPASATDNALARFDTTTGKLIQNSIAILTDAGALSGLTGLASTSATISGLTSGRVTYAGTGGLLQDSANLTFDGSTITTLNAAYTGTLTGGTGVVNLGSGQFYKDASGNVIIGTTAIGFAEKFRVYGNYSVFDNGTYTGFIGAGNSLGTGISTDFAFRSSNAMAFLTGGATERMRIDSSGNVGIGTSSPTNYGAGTTTLSISNTTGSGYLDFYNAGGRRGYHYATASTYNISTTTATALVFETVGTERMRIDSSGNLLVGGTSTIGPAKITAYFSGSTSNGIDLQNTNAANAGTFAAFFNSSSGLAGFITQNGATGVLYVVTSDYRLKNVVSPVSDAGTRLDALQPIEYDWKAGGRTRGFLAHQFAEVYPNSVSGEKDAVDKEGKPVYQGMQASSPEVMADLIAEIQSLRKRVAQLEAK